MVALSTQLLLIERITSSTSRFVGRQRELQFIRNHYEAARGGKARMILLVGELGIGKTRLLDEVAAHAAQDGLTVLRGGASEAEGMPPYLPFLEALGQYIRLTPPDQLREQVAVAPRILASLLPELAHSLGELPTAYSLPPEQARLRLFRSDRYIPGSHQRFARARPHAR
jgi:predicted ATPase